MVRHHLPPEHATPARAYLQAFLGEQEAADAMHEVVEDVTYWGDDSLPAVLAAAHSVLISRVRVTGEAAASWLIDELGLAPDVAATITGADVAATDEPVSAPQPSGRNAARNAARRGARHGAGDEIRNEETAPATREAAAPAGVEPMRIGFDEEPLPSTLFDGSPAPARGRLIAGLLVIGGLLAVAVLLLTR